MVIVVLLMFFGSFFGNNLHLENLQPLAEPSKGWLASIVGLLYPWHHGHMLDLIIFHKQQKSLTLCTKQDI